MSRSSSRILAPRRAAAPMRAFTLIELLVVIAIIAILAAILFPVFAQAREKGRQAACISNLKQIAMAYRMYMDDYDMTAPAPGAGTGVTAQAQSLGRSSFRRADDPWSLCAVLDPYIKNRGVWICPSSLVREDLPEGQRNTYAYTVSSTSLNNVANFEEDASTTVIVWDSYTFRDYSAVGVIGQAPTLSAALRRPPHHNTSVNWAYLDGSVLVGHPTSRRTP